MSDILPERDALERRAAVVRSRLLRTVDALAHRQIVRTAIGAATDDATRQRLKDRARRAALAGGGLLVLMGVAALVVHLVRRR